MSLSNIVLYETESLRLKSILAMTVNELHADLVLLIDRSGQQIASEGPARDIDLTALASLAAANIAATEGLAKLVSEPEFSIIYHQGRNRNIHISDVLKQFSLVLVFDDTVSLGMVRLRVRRATAYLEEVFRGFKRKSGKAVAGRTAASGGAVPLYFTDEEIDNLFNNMQPISGIGGKA